LTITIDRLAERSHDRMGFVIVGIILFVIAGVLLWKRRPYHHRMNLLRRAVPATAGDVPNAYPGEVVSLTGTARLQRDFRSDHTQTPCVYYSSTVERRYERRRGMISGGIGPGRRRRHRNTQRGREIVSENEQHVPSLIEDTSGTALVNPDGAEFDARKVLDRYEPERGQGNPFGIPGLDIDINIGGGSRTLGHTYREHVIPADASVFIAGIVNENGQIGSNNPSGGPSGLIISHRPESTLRNEWGKRETWQLYGAIGTAGFGLLLWFVAAGQWVINAI
jgi:hypothetical protein